MASARNKVIKGDYIEWSVFKGVNAPYLHLTFGGQTDIILNKATIESYEIITEE